MSWSFVRRLPHYPRMSLRVREVSSEGAGFVRRVDVRPGRFIVLDPRTRSPDWRIPEDRVTRGEIVGPLQPAMYLARVDDVDSEGACAVTLWEVPNGLMGTTTLSVEAMAGHRPELGDTLRVYTWMEVPKAGEDGFGPAQPRVVVEPTPRSPPTAAQLAALRVALAALEEEVNDA